MRKTITVCDVCQDDLKPTARYTLTGPTERATVDLCKDDSKAINDLLHMKRGEASGVQQQQQRGAKKASAGRRSPRRTLTIEEIEQGKKEGTV